VNATPWIRALLQKLRVAQLVKFPAFYGTWVRSQDHFNNPYLWPNNLTPRFFTIHLSSHRHTTASIQHNHNFVWLNDWRSNIVYCPVNQLAD
jgi:hypothetical protein